MTQQDVAGDFQITRQAVSAWEVGKTLPSLAEVWEMCLLYGASADYLLFGMKTVPASSAAVVQHLFRDRDTPAPGCLIADGAECAADPSRLAVGRLGHG